MIYLSGCWKPAIAGLHSQLGLMLTKAQKYPATVLEPGLTWAADTGCFARPEAFSLSAYLGWLEGRRAYRDRCLFVTAPDRFADGPGTLAAALPAIPEIRAAGWPVAFVAQPGTEHSIPWGLIDALFVGGPDEWQTSTTVQQLTDHANGRGLWTHRGRVNTYGRMVATAAKGFRSSDGTTLGFGWDTNIGFVLAALDRIEQQPCLL